MKLVFRSSRMKRKIFQGVSNPDNVTFFPLYLAKAAGYFLEQCLETQMVVVDSDLRVELAPRTREVENAF